MTYDLVPLRPGSFPDPDIQAQYTLTGILAVWAAATLPMGILSWGLAPIIMARTQVDPGLIYWGCIILGMVWQFALATMVLCAERQIWTWPALRRRLWLQTPRHAGTGRPDARLYWWIVPAILFVFVTSDYLGPVFDAPLRTVLPPAMLPDYGDIHRLARPEFHGQWGLMAMALVSCVFNYILGEALLFHGVLLPRMLGVFGRWAWLANAILFGLYHVHLIWALPSIIISNLAYSWPAQKFRSVWLAVVIHGFEAFALILGVSLVILGPG